MKTSASIDVNGQLRPHEHQKWANWCAKHKGQRVEVEVRDMTMLQGDQQRKYWFGAVVETFNQIWTRERKRALPYASEAIHGLLMESFGPEEAFMDRPDGTRERPHWPKLTVAQRSELIDAAKEYLLHEYDSVLPSPEEWQE